MTHKPTIHLTNAASRRPPHRGPGRVWTIMAAPRARYGESGEGVVRALVPYLGDLRAAQAGEISAQEYRRRFVDGVVGRVGTTNLMPGLMVAWLRDPNEIAPAFVADGDTLICACSRDAAARGECHRVWAAELLAEAGWRVVLDGVDKEEAR